VAEEKVFVCPPPRWDDKLITPSNEGSIQTMALAP